MIISHGLRLCWHALPETRTPYLLCTSSATFCDDEICATGHRSEYRDGTLHRTAQDARAVSLEASVGYPFHGLHKTITIVIKSSRYAPDLGRGLPRWTFAFGEYRRGSMRDGALAASKSRSAAIPGSWQPHGEVADVSEQVYESHGVMAVTDRCLAVGLWKAVEARLSTVVWRHGGDDGGEMMTGGRR